jgi:hypothetical protein
MVRSNVLPNAIWLRKTEIVNDQLYLILRVRSNVTEVPVEDMRREKVTHYDYDETEVRYPVPDGVTEMTDIQSLIANEATNIIIKATQTRKWQYIHALPLAEMREGIQVVPVEINPTPVGIIPKALG